MKIEKNGIRWDPNLDAINQKVRQHMNRRMYTILIVGGIFCGLFLLGWLWSAVRSYSSYEIRYRADRAGVQSSKFTTLEGNIVEYSNDGISCMTVDQQFLWNQSFEMSAPAISVCESFLCIYDVGGTELYIIKTLGIQKKIETFRPIQKVCIAKQGTIAVLMNEASAYYLKLYDVSGEELANGEFYGDKGSYPVDIALSYDARKLALCMVDVTEGMVQSSISFYNYGTVGQNEVDNLVGTFIYPDLFIPEIKYVSDNKMIAFGDHQFLVFEGKEKPQEIRRMDIEQEINSVFSNEKYIGIVYDNYPEELFLEPEEKEQNEQELLEERKAFHIEVYDFRGSKVMEHDTSILYDSIFFMENNEICVKDDSNCELFTVHSIKKFQSEFDHKLQYIVPMGGSQNYVFIFEDEILEVRLR